MLTALLLGGFVVISLAGPLAQYGPSQTTNVTAWQPAPGSKTTCDKTSDKIIGFYQGPQLETVLDNACAEMMSPCAYQERLSQDIVCAQTINWNLPESVSSIQDANVETSEGKKISGWDVKFTVAPPEQPQGAPFVSWTRQECYGYFAHLLEKWEDKGGCHTNRGFGIGKIEAGGDTPLKGAVFELTIVPAKEDG
ncbi:hypothetical protein BDU57DRAFT_493796 [Ampelomyces quisqualis]|uniref:Uncharacterized protein n=1 Tax=Ampelomyces quisqualis TaxID=50730 RepID=A0A6A5QSU9_AMPQU|nr:hypothetical protein BDU57DRAFT_493796 [Ampelomyces quisqualis]